MSTLIDTNVLTEDIFEAEQRGAQDSFDPTTPREYRRASSAEEVFQDYADKHTKGDVELLFGHLYAQQFRVEEVAGRAKDNPYGLSAYRQAQGRALNLTREAEKVAPAPEITSPEEVYNATPRRLGEFGVFFNDIDDEDYGLVKAHPTDPVWPHIDNVAKQFYTTLSDKQRGKLPLMTRTYEINYDWIRSEAINQLDKRKVPLTDPKYKEKLNAEVGRQVNGWLAMGTVGLHSATIRMAAEELLEGSDSPIDIALGSTIKLVGQDKSGYPIYLTESSAHKATRMFDSVEGGLVGAFKYATDIGPIDAAARGIAEGANLMTELSSAGETSGIPGASAAGMVAGFGASLFMPDLATLATLGGSKVVKGVGKLTKSLEAAGVDVTRAGRIATAFEEAATDIRKGLDTNDTALLEKGTKRIEQLKAENKALTDEFDRALEAVGAERAAAVRDLAASGRVDPDDVEEISTILRAADEMPMDKVVKPPSAVHNTSPVYETGFELRPAIRRHKSQKTTKTDVPVIAKSGEGSTYNFANQLRMVSDELAELDKAGAYKINAVTARKKLGEVLTARYKAVQPEMVSDGNKAMFSSKAHTEALKSIRKAVKETSDEELELIIETMGGINPNATKQSEEAFRSLANRLYDTIEGSVDLTKGEKAADKMEELLERAAKLEEDKLKKTDDIVDAIGEVDEKAVAALDAGFTRYKEEVLALEDRMAQASETFSEQVEVYTQRLNALKRLENALDANKVDTATIAKSIEGVKAELTKLDLLQAEIRALAKEKDISLVLYTQAARLREAGVPDEAIAKLIGVSKQQDVALELAKRYTATAIKKAKSKSYARTIAKKFKAAGIEFDEDVLKASKPSEIAASLRGLRDSLRKELRGGYAEALKATGQDVSELKKTLRAAEKEGNTITRELAADLKATLKRKAKLQKEAGAAAKKADAQMSLKAELVERDRDLQDALRKRLTKIRSEADVKTADLASKYRVASDDALKARKAKEAAQANLDKVKNVVLPARERYLDRLSELVVDAVDDTAKFFYGGPTKTYRAAEQLRTIRKGIEWNARITAEAADEFAQMLRTTKMNDPRFVEYRDPVKRLARIKNAGSLWKVDPHLDPASVANVLDVWEIKYGVVKDDVVAGILKGKPLRVKDVEGNEILLTSHYLSDQQINESVKRFGDVVMEDPQVAFDIAAESVQVLDTTSAIDRSLFRGAQTGTTRQILGYARSALMGDHVHADLNNLNPVIREVALEITRGVAQTISDVAKLLKAEDYPTMYKYFSGEGAKFDNGRHIMSSRAVSVASSYALTIERFVNNMPVGERAGVKRLLELPLNADGTVDSATINADEGLLKAFGDLSERFQKSLSQGAPDEQDVDGAGEIIKSVEIFMPVAIRDVIKAVQESDYKVATNITHETLGMIAAIYRASGKASDPVKATESMFTAIRRAYHGGDKGMQAMHKAAPVMAAHTKATSIVHRVGDYNLLMGKEDFNQWNRFVQGMPISDEFRNGVLMDMRRRFGTDVKMVGVDVMGEVKYMPQKFQLKYKQSLQRAMDQSSLLRSSPSASEETAKRFVSEILRRTIQQRVTGTFLFRSPFGIDTLREGWDNTFTFMGASPAAIHTFMMFSRIPTMVPGVLQLSHAARVATRNMGKFLGSTGFLDKGPEYAEKLAKISMEAGPDTPLKLTDHFSNKALEVLFEYVGASKWGASVNDIVAGSDELLEVNGKMYTGASLREFAVGRGVTGGAYQSNYFAMDVTKHITGTDDPEKAVSFLEKAHNLTKEEAHDMLELVQNYAEALGERERIGLFVTLLNTGQTPPEAALNVSKILHDYQTRATALDRSMFVRMCIPFWSYAKNNARLQINSLTDPATAYRAGITRKGVSNTAAVIQDYLDSYYVDEFGVEDGLMEPEDKEAYDRFKQEMYRLNGGEKFDEGEVAFIRAAMLGITSPAEYKGSYYNADYKRDNMQLLMQQVDFDKYVGYVPNNAALLKPWHRDRTSVVMPKSLGHKRTKDLRSVVAEPEWNYVTLPEAGQFTAIRHFVTLAELAGEVAFGVADATGIYESQLPPQARLMHTTEQINSILSIDFMPLNRFLLNAIGLTSGVSRPVRVPEALGQTLQKISSDNIIEVKEVEVEGVGVKEKRYYMPEGVAVLLDLAPALGGTLRDTSSLTKMDVGASGEMAYDAAMLMLKLAGIRVERTQASRVTSMSEPGTLLEMKGRPKNR